MLRKLQNLLASLLFHVLDFPPAVTDEYSEKDKAQIEQWMISCYSDPGYQKFFAYRHRKFIRSLTNGLGMGEEPRDKYIRVSGQRFEILRWNQLMKQVFDKNSRKAREKIRKEQEEKKAP